MTALAALTAKAVFTDVFPPLDKDNRSSILNNLSFVFDLYYQFVK